MEQVRNVRQYFKKRYVMYFITTILILAIPFIRINGNHIFYFLLTISSCICLALPLICKSCI